MGKFTIGNKLYGQQSTGYLQLNITYPYIK